MTLKSLIRPVLAVAMAGLMAGEAAAAPNIRIFSYEPANAETRRAAGQAGFTFEFRQRFIINTVLRVLSTAGAASAPLAQAQDRDLGAPLGSLIGEDAVERDLYEVKPEAQGPDLIHAFCPGSTRAWFAFGRIDYNRPLRIHVLGDTPAGGPAHRCMTLDFQFKGEWRIPRNSPVTPPNPGAAPRLPF